MLSYITSIAVGAFTSKMIMRQPGLQALSLCILVALLSFAFAKDQPKISKQQFDTPPTNLQYFEDSDTILVHERQVGNVWITTDGGAKWERVKDIDEGQAWEVYLHPFDNQVAFCIGMKNKHWVTHDQGKTWTSFETSRNLLPTSMPPPLSFHAGNSKKILMHAQECFETHCEISTYYTTDGFKDHLAMMKEGSRACIFAHSTPQFKTNVADRDNDRVLCVARGRYSNLYEDNRLLASDDFFETEYEPKLAGDHTVQGIISQAVVKGYLVAAAASRGTDELALYVTDDAETWHRAIFPHDHKIKEEAYTILESTNYSIQVDVMTTTPYAHMGVLCSSNSNGTYFTEMIEHTNRDITGRVDFEKIQDIQGILLVNVVDNWKDVETGKSTDRKVKTQISFDDGHTFHDTTAGKKTIHLHSVTQMSNVGRIFSSSAPGLVMGVGNTGDHLKDYSEGDLYVSDDAGLTWRLALEEAHKYEFGDQGSVLMAVYDEGATDEIQYSLDHGKKWKSVQLDEKVRPRVLTTTPDSTSLKFVMLATEGGGSKMKYYIYTVDFEGLHERKCGDKDFEKWYARKDEDGKPTCLMGHKQWYNRRKADADCFIDEEFKNPKPQSEICDCTMYDFECDFNFIRSEDRKTCEPATTLSVPEGECKDPSDTYKGSSGFRKIPGNDCRHGIDMTEEIDRSCKDTIKAPSSGKVSHKSTPFKGNNFREYFYLERSESNSGDDETVVMRTDLSEVWLSKDHGKSWTRPKEFEDSHILAIVPHQYFNDAIYFITDEQKVWYTINRGKSFSSFSVPELPTLNVRDSLGFHPQKMDWLLWTGLRDCEGGNPNCHARTSYTTDRGEPWHPLKRYVQRCQFVNEGDQDFKEALVYCAAHKDETKDSPIALLSSDDWFGKSQTHFDDIIAFATMAEFIIVAARNDTNLKVDASVDGKTFADAQFPRNFQVEHQIAYTVLDSSTHAVFLNVAVGNRDNFEYGTIIKSNSNGTSYVLSVNGVNRNARGYVDFEKMLGLEGVAVVNVVENMQDETKGAEKRLKTLMTHDDGATWAPLAAPKKDSLGANYKCNVGHPDGCSLQLHGYTERPDPRDTFSSPTAIGLMMGVGNVGPYLLPMSEASTFLTSDGGVTWKEVMKGNYQWEFGDQGSIIVIVEQGVAVRDVLYSLDEGDSWTKYQFSDEDLIVAGLTTVPSDNSRNFLIWAKNSKVQGEIVTVNLDFTGLTDRKCVLNEDDPEADDYYLWSPRHPMHQDDYCLFGHVAQYERKRAEKSCYNGRKFDHLHTIAKNCSCVRQDFEW